MSTDKRARQKANRASRVAAAEEADRKARARSRMITYGTIALVVVGAIIAVAVVVSDDDPSETAVEEPGAVDQPIEEPVDTVPGTPATIPPGALGEGDCPEPDGSSPRTIDFTDRQPLCIDLSAEYTAVFDTSEGEITIELDPATAPNTVNNFVTLARWGYYDDTTLFRTDPSIDIIQGGAPHTESASDPGPGYTIPDEPDFGATGPYRYVPGQIVMARGQGEDSSSAQFFFTTGEKTSLLDGRGTYIVFGETDAGGLQVMQDIIGLHEPGESLGGAPSRTVTVNSVTILEG